jgi:hypothetical protein
VAWTVDLAGGGQYEAYLHWACAGDSAGNGFVIEGVTPELKGVVGGTGGYDRYRTIRLGRVSLPAGKSRIGVRPDGRLTNPHLMDLRGIYLVPVGTPADRALAGNAPGRGPDAAAAIGRLLDGLAVGTPAEYERIPKIWEEAIAAGKRNDANELVRVLDLSLPKEGEPLADWQAVVIGGGVINGISQQNEWPRARIARLFSDYPRLQAQWKHTMALATKMADDPAVATGTRYDALRILGLGQWEPQGSHLVKYLDKDADDELNMGAVSGLSDIDSPEVADALIAAFADLNADNQRLAADALLRTDERTRAFKAAVESGAVPRDALPPEVLERLNAK